jgi:endonuclease-3
METDNKHLAEKAEKIYTVLSKEYPIVNCALTFKNPLELMVASILSAQCTDERVNKVTKALFKKYRSAKDYAGADLSALEEDVHSTGFFRNKARALKQSMGELAEKHNGKVPDTMEELTALTGIGRKTANLVLACAFNKPGIIVDTHVFRISRRLGLTDKKSADKIEFDLRDIMPEEYWTRFSLLVVAHGRDVCKAKKPRCLDCTIQSFCDYFFQNENEK